MNKISDEKVKEFLEYLVLRTRCSSFEDDFKKKIINYYISYGEDKNTAIYMSINLWNLYNNNGMIKTYQEFISDELAINALVYAINN